MCSLALSWLGNTEKHWAWSLPLLNPSSATSPYPLGLSFFACKMGISNTPRWMCWEDRREGCSAWTWCSGGVVQSIHSFLALLSICSLKALELSWNQQTQTSAVFQKLLI